MDQSLYNYQGSFKFVYGRFKVICMSGYDTFQEDIAPFLLKGATIMFYGKNWKWAGGGFDVPF